MAFWAIALAAHHGQAASEVATTGSEPSQPVQEAPTLSWYTFAAAVTTVAAVAVGGAALRFCRDAEAEACFFFLFQIKLE